MLLLRYAGMADLYTGARSASRDDNPGIRGGSFGEPVYGRTGHCTALSLDLPSPGLPADHATCGTPPCPGG
jgi:hypothetical protein